MECRLVGDGELVCPRGQTAPLLESVDASLDRVALFVCLGVEGWCVARLACGDAEDQGSCTAVAGEMDFRAQAAAGASESVIAWFRAI